MLITTNPRGKDVVRLGSKLGFTPVVISRTVFWQIRMDGYLECT
jgi:hypothetical protein